MVHGGMIFTNHASGYIQSGQHVNFSDGDSLNFKLKYERDATNFGVVVQAYHINNGVLNSKQFMEVIIGQ